MQLHGQSTALVLLRPDETLKKVLEAQSLREDVVVQLRVHKRDGCLIYCGSGKNKVLVRIELAGPFTSQHKDSGQYACVFDGHE